MRGGVEQGGKGRGRRLRVAIWVVAACLLLLPLVAMRFTEEVNWSPMDFAVFGAMLVAACGTYELAARLTGSTAYRAAVGTAVATAFVLVWLNLAVGIIGSEGDPANLVFVGVLGVGVAGSVLARLWPRGMMRALVATALAQASVAVVALAAGGAEAGVLTATFVAPWLFSAWLFGRAARERAPAGAAPRGEPSA